MLADWGDAERKLTDRVSVLVGTDPQRSRAGRARALSHGRMESGTNPYGDGSASRRTVDALLDRFGRD